MRCPTLAELPTPPPGKTGWPWTEESEQLPETMPAQSEVEGIGEDGSSFVVRRSSAPVHRPSSRTWPRISIVTPSYNQGQFIEETIRSVLLQGYPNLEYIVIDGNSDDGSVEVIKKYEPWLTYWVSEPDRGQSHAINKGFSRTTGKIMAWLNSDDVYQIGAIAIVARQIVDKQKTMLVGESVKTGRPTELSGTLDCRKPNEAEMFYEGRTFPQPSVFWSADLWSLAGPIEEEFNFVMDYDLWLRMVKMADHVQHKNTVLSYERTHSQQKMSQVRKNSDLSDIQILEKAYAILRAIRARGGNWFSWLLVGYGRRIWQMRHNWTFTRLRGSRLQRAVLSIVLQRPL
jgi:glycosyltransferase involved in cell wall biosynthesis